MAKEAHIIKKEKSNNLVMILSVLLVVSLLFGGFYFYRAQSITSEKAKEVVECKSLGNSFLIDSCYLQSALSESDAEACSNIVGANVRDVCYIEVNKVQKQDWICKAVTDKFYMQPKCYAESKVVPQKI